MKKQLVARVAFALLVSSLVLGTGERTVRLMAQAPGEGEFILRASPNRVAAIANRHGLTIVRRLGDRNVFLVRGPVDGPPPPPRRRTRNTGPRDDDERSRRLMNRARADRDIEDFHVNAHALITETVETPDLNQTTVAILDTVTGTVATYFGTTVWEPYISQPALGVIQLPDALQVASGTGVTIAIIDTGVDENHPALQGALVSGYDFTRDQAGPGSEWPDLNQTTVAILDQNPPVPIDLSTLPPAFGHGTMVAGLVHVVAPAAKIMPLKAFTADGVATMFGIVQAIYYAVDHGAKVINMSFSMESGAEITDAIDYASAHGVITLASVGNSGVSTTVYPAAFRNVLGIASTTLTDDRASFSNFGDHLVKFAAPGESLVTLYPAVRYASVSGTSFSTGLATGGAALLAQLEPALDQRQASRYLDDGALKKPDWQLGDGRINLRETLQAHVPIPPDPPPPPPPDTTPPTVTLTSPTGGATVTGLFPIAANASDNVGVVGVQFTLDGANVGAEVAAPYELNWESTAVPNGTHVWSAVAHDAAGNQQTAASVTVTVFNDTTAPTVAVTSPAEGAIVTGAITFGASASDDVGVAGVQFTIDGVNLGAEDTVAPYGLTWNSGTVPNGVHVLGAVARDAAGNQHTATSVSITVINDTTRPNVAVTDPIAGSTVNGVVMLGVTAGDNVGVVGVQFTLDGVNLGPEDLVAPYTMTWNSATLPNGGHMVGAVARDAAGNSQTAASVSITVFNDTTAPTVAVTSPAEGAIVTGTITFGASASDDVGVAGVQFTIDGVNLGAEDTVAPYERTWNSGTVPNGVHVLGAVARDAAGNQQTATSVSVTVFNDTTAPTVAVTSPADGAIVTGTITFGASASDDVGVVGVQFAIDGVNLGPEATAAPYEIVWDSSAVANGVRMLTAVARDAAGNQQTSSVSVIVANVP